MEVAVDGTDDVDGHAFCDGQSFDVLLDFSIFGDIFFNIFGLDEFMDADFTVHDIFKGLIAGPFGGLIIIFLESEFDDVFAYKRLEGVAVTTDRRDAAGFDMGSVGAWFP